MPNESATLWEVEITVRGGRPDADFLRTQASLQPLRDFIQRRFQQTIPAFRTTRGYLVQTPCGADVLAQAARRILVDVVIEDAVAREALTIERRANAVTILRKPGVMDPVALTARTALADQGAPSVSVRAFRRCIFEEPIPEEMVAFLARKALANEAVEQIVLGGWKAEHLGAGAEYAFNKIVVSMHGMDDDALMKLSKEGQLYLNPTEMRSIRDHFAAQGRDPTDVELETIAQTWSEHCSHKTFRGPYELNGERGASGLLKDTIMHATRTLARDWCISVFSDNAGIVRFDDQWNVCFKVETHNHPSAIEPYGGANTGLGGVIRDILGAGLGAKPICNTDVFCVAPPDTPPEALPDGVLQPERVLRGIVAGVRDYGNRMGIPTVNGAVVCDDRYLGNPLVFCGTVGLIPADKCFGAAQPGDLIVALGGRTGRDGIHGATFSSGELTRESETVSGGAVQIGNAVTEKQVADVLLRARDRNLFTAVTDCGAGGFSSAVGEMGAELGADVRLEAATLKYYGLSYTEIWISEAQERMVLAVPPKHWEELRELAASEEVDAVVLGTFEASGRLKLSYNGRPVGDLDMHYLHEGRPQVLRKGVWQAPPRTPHQIPADVLADLGKTLHALLGAWNVASKEWIIRQYDHEVQGGSIVKPLVGVGEDGPSDAAVITPVLGSYRGLAIGCGLQPRFGDLDPYRMAASAVDEAMRNVVAVGGDPRHTSLLDNFCWGNAERPETFGALCLAAFACRDTAIAFGAPFISGKDSLNNEFAAGDRRIVIPPTLLISAMAIVPDVRRAVTMDLKEPGNLLLLVGLTKAEMGGSHFNLVTGSTGGEVPTVDAPRAAVAFARVHEAIAVGLIRSCHDLSEGGMAVALAEMAFAGSLGLEIDLDAVPVDRDLAPFEVLFSESNSRLLLEVRPRDQEEVKRLLDDAVVGAIGQVVVEPTLTIKVKTGRTLIREEIAAMKESWQRPFSAQRH